MKLQTLADWIESTNRSVLKCDAGWNWINDIDAVTIGTPKDASGALEPASNDTFVLEVDRRP